MLVMTAPDVDALFDNNRAWAASMLRRDPSFFHKLTQQHAPKFLWIGCSDSRVPANEIVGLMPGELFVHRNVANQVGATDANCQSVVEFAVDGLEVEHVIVCGHYGCAGVQAGLKGSSFALTSFWTRPIRALDLEICRRTQGSTLTDGKRRRLLEEVNVLAQLREVALTEVVQKAWDAGRELQLHAWIYDIADGLLRDLGMNLRGGEDVQQMYRDAAAERIQQMLQSA